MKNERPIACSEDWLLARLETTMRKEGKSEATIGKYLRDVRRYLAYAKNIAGDCFEQETASEYREILFGIYTANSANSIISAINYFFRTFEKSELVLRKMSTQRRPFRTEMRELSMSDYRKLIDTADKLGKRRLKLIMQTLASTGIRIGELKFITVEAIRKGSAEVVLKRKIRVILLPHTLRLRLIKYIHQEGILRGPVFITKNGNPVDRSNILHEMKALAEDSGIDKRKVFPHNFRHLFAVTYYKSEKDICHLADILGHSNLNTTRIYTATGESEHSKSLERLGFL